LWAYDEIRPPFEHFGHAILDRLSSLARNLLSERREFLGLFRPSFELLARMRRRQLSELCQLGHSSTLASEKLACSGALRAVVVSLKMGGSPAHTGPLTLNGPIPQSELGT
jgi:hypothetical protein